MAETRTAVKKERLYSLVVAGWLRDHDAEAGHHISERRVRVVAATNAEAIATARALLDPAGAYPVANWEIVDGGELPPDSSDPGNSSAKWSAWRMVSTAPEMNEAIAR